jgi:hypothetical protein
MQVVQLTNNSSIIFISSYTQTHIIDSDSNGNLNYVKIAQLFINNIYIFNNFANTSTSMNKFMIHAWKIDLFLYLSIFLKKSLIFCGLESV